MGTAKLKNENVFYTTEKWCEKEKGTSKKRKKELANSRSVYRLSRGVKMKRNHDNEFGSNAPWRDEKRRRRQRGEERKGKKQRGGWLNKASDKR